MRLSEFVNNWRQVSFHGDNKALKVNRHDYFVANLQ